MVDRVLQYENLSADLARLAAELGVKSDISLPARRAKSGYRQDKRHYSEILTRADRVLIDRLCYREIAELGYEFEGG